MNSTMTEVEGIVLKVQDYKENDALAWLLTETEILTVRIRGYQKTTSKLRNCAQCFSHVRWQIHSKAQGFSLLIHGTCIDFFAFQNNLLRQSIAFVLRDIFLKIDGYSSYLNLFLSILHAVSDTDQEFYFRIVWLLKQILINEGIQPYTDGCILCHRTDRLQVLSKTQGGFLCSNCNTDKKTDKKEELIKIYSIFHAELENFELCRDRFVFSLQDVLYWCEWFEYYQQVHLKSLDFVKQIVKLESSA